MAIDFLVGLFLLCSASVNLLALGAFWVTPSLRNGLANRFVVNLLLVNLVCCVVLAPSLLLNTLTFSTEIVVTPTGFEQFPSLPTALQNDSCRQVDNGCIIPTNEVQSEYINDKIAFTEFRSWGLDFVVAAATFSILLVVGDTFCAVTDPLRYHTRLSDRKAWIFVALVWIIGLIFGVASAFRSEHVLTETDAVYNTTFSYTYFICAILAPFVFICGMYWRIFSEARESGQRMRQNGSSPLLQSALNLAQVSAATAHQHVDRCGGLIMKIDTGTKVVTINNNNNNVNGSNNNVDDSSNDKSRDDDNNNDKESTQQLLNSNNPFVDYKLENEIEEEQKQPKQQLHLNLKNEPFELNLDNNLKKHNPPTLADGKSCTTIDSSHKIKLTLTTSSSSGQIRRNLSAKQFVIENLDEKQNIRHASSTPDLNKLNNRFELNPTMVLPLPTVHVPTKALNYMTSIRHRLSNASSLFKYREESRAARISILVVIMFLVSYLPYGILVVMQGHDDLLEASNQSLLAIFSVVLANLSSPFIFAYRNKRVRRGALRLLGVEKQATERLQKFQNSTLKRKTTTFINLNRSSSHASTYSGSSCKYLTVAPHNTAVTLNGSYIVELDKLSPCYEESLSSPGATVTLAYTPIKSVPEIHGLPAAITSNNSTNTTTTTTTIITTSNVNDCKVIKKSILKRVCDTSKIWGCNCAVNIDNQSLENKVLPTPV